MNDFYVLLTLDELKLVIDCLEHRIWESENDKEKERHRKLVAYFNSQVKAETK